MADGEQPQKPPSGDRQRAVLSEEAFVADLEGILERDFYPDLPRLRAKLRYLEAREGGGAAQLPTPLQTPSASSEAASTSVAAQQQQPQPSVSLDTYLCRNTSEDNESFQALMDECERRRRLKYAWFYEQEAALKQHQLSLKEGREAAADNPPALTGGLDSWPGYQVRSALMYPASDAALTSETVGEAAEAAPSKNGIAHENTRFRRGAPFQGTSGSSSSAASSTMFSTAANRAGGHFGTDGLELRPPTAPAAASSASYLATPSPAPGAMFGESPLMTWGDVEGTPCRLDETPSAGGGSSGLPYFRIPAVPTVQLADRLGRHRRQTRQREAAAAAASAASKASSSKTTPSPVSLGLSPAAKRLLRLAAAKRTSAGGSDVVDKALRASYRSPSVRSAGGGSSVSASVRSTASSITDGLLPGTPKAGDGVGGR